MTTLLNHAKALTAAALLCATSCLAASDVDSVSKISIASVNKVQVIETDSEYLLQVDIAFENKNPEAIKLRNAKFHSIIESKGKSTDLTIDIGDTTIDELEIPGAANKKTPGQVVKTVTITLGSKNQDSVSKMIKLWNILGNPTAPMTLVLKGSSEFGTKLPNGWVFEQGKTYEVELRFVPTVQRRVLFI
jgi:hypothetical protein